ncbi:MAG: hypothetical protein HZA36_00240 [Parcubacteria group bacterium]|nr:hypothetical protein [Parcubacteria group bacterium]
MLLLFQKISTFFILVSFLAIALFSVAIMAHGADGSMLGNCPFSVFDDASLCPQDVLAVVRHHVSTYYAFLNISLHSDVTMSIIAFLLLVCSTLIASVAPYVFLSSLNSKQYYNVSPSISSSGRKITRWLSLLTYSPSVT